MKSATDLICVATRKISYVFSLADMIQLTATAGFTDEYFIFSHSIIVIFYSNGNMLLCAMRQIYLNGQVNIFSNFKQLKG